ncbi:MAG TPA: sulfatase-like hydrolase/transferase, partial [Actinomycetes bacterium]|nr:sulfatase-like hydrolase/transferase [Actinomycetes bacterium]
SIVFENAVSETSWTRPAVASLFTGVPPRAHGVNGRQDALPDEAVTLAEMLSALGYQTAGFTTNGNVAPLFGFGQGFGTYELLPGSLKAGLRAGLDEQGDGPPSSSMVSRLSAWFADRRATAPLFLYVHTVDPHSPYYPAPEWKARFAADVPDAAIGSLANLRRLLEDRSAATPSELRGMLALYDAEVAEADEGFGQFLGELKRRRLYDGAAILLVADHGEEFWDHGSWQHGHTLYGELVRVPFVLKLPAGRQAGLRVRGAVQLADVLPTVLDLLGETVPKTVTGRSLLGRLNPATPAWAGTAYSFLDLDSRRAETAQADGFKLVRRPTEDGPARALFDVVHDPRERSDLLAQQPIRAGYLERLLDAAAARERPLWSRREAGSSPETEENLRALGYVR